MAKQATNGDVTRRNFLKLASGVAGAAVVGLPQFKEAMAQPIPFAADLSKEQLLEGYRKMQLIRRGEIKVRELLKSGNPPEGLRGAFHSSEGEEACCVGVAMAMRLGHDYLGHTHRSHGYPIAMGVDIGAWMAELMGRETGTNKGHGGSMHIADPSKGMLGAISIIAQGYPHAVGAAYSAKVRGTDQVAIGTLGDGASNQGAFHESINIATIWELPAVFIVHNNGWRINVPARWENAPVKRGKDLSVRAAAFGIPGITVDGNDMWAVYKAAKYAIDNTRAGKGPYLLELVTYRHRAHGNTVGEHEVLSWPHNDRAEYEYWMRRDPITRFESTVLSGGDLTQDELDGVVANVDAAIEEAVQFAVDSPFENPEECFADVLY